MKKIRSIFKKKLIYLLLMGVLLVIINTALTYYEYNEEMKFSIEETEFSFVSLTNEQLILTDQAGSKLTVYLDELASTNHFYPLRGEYTVIYKNIEIIASDTNEKGTRELVTKDGRKFKNYIVQKESYIGNSFERNLVIEIGQLYAVVRGYGFKSLFVSNTLILLVMVLISKPIETKYDLNNKQTKFTNAAVGTFFATFIILFQLSTIAYKGRFHSDIFNFIKNII